VYQFRPFRNSDPPALCTIWNQQPPQRGLAHSVSPTTLEPLVFGKPYFDRQGLILASRDGQPVGFAHAGFGPTDDGAHLETDMGAVCMVMVVPDEAETELGPLLVEEAEKYLQQRGAKLIYGGGIRPLNPFYLGLYGGSELPGTLESDQWRQGIYRSRGYREIDRVRIFHRELAGFRAIVNREQMQLRRQTVVEAVPNGTFDRWWDAYTLGIFEPVRFELRDKQSGEIWGGASVWDVQPLSLNWGVQVAGLVDVQVEPDHRRQGVATHLLSEIMRQLDMHGVALLEVQAMQNNARALALYRKLGFDEVDQGVVLRK